MKYPRYPKYKPSGVEWLGDVPAHWGVSRLKRVSRLIYGDSLAAENRVEGEVPVYGSNGIVGSHDVANTKAPCLIVGRKGSFGKVAYSDVPSFAIDTTYFIDSRSTTADIRWLYYVLGCLGLDTISKDSAVPGLEREDAYSNVILLASLDEQRAIAEFLDGETARIDALIAKKQQLIELLAEKRTALISQAVTKGLNPNVPMKDSGVEWLGEIPAHWDVKAIKFVARVGNGSTPSRENADYWWNGEYPWLNSSVANQERVTEAFDFVTQLALQECHLPRIEPPAVLVGITGQGKTRGMATTLRIEATINQHLAYLKPIAPLCDVDYLRRSLDRAYLYLRSESEGGGSTKGAITCEQLATMKVSIPPLTEQCAIADYIERERTKIDSMAIRIEEVISRVQEYRAAIISEAVTGKIDVRNLAEAREVA